MGITAVTSNAIVDSTATGRSLITAANAAAGRAVLEIEDGSYNWTADHVFEGTIAASTYDFITAVDGKVNHPDLAGNFYVSFNDANVFRFTNLDFIPMSTGTKNLGRSDLRFADVFSVDGDFSGTVTANELAGDGTGSVFLTQPSVGSPIWVKHGTAVSYALYNTTFRPAGSGDIELGLGTNRWEKTWSVNGSFSGNLINEVGGSYKLYNLGQAGDADTEYLELSYVSNAANIETKSTGTGGDRNLYLRAAGVHRLYVGGNLLWNNSSTISEFYGSLKPASDGLRYCGQAGNRWSNVASVDGDFSGTLSAVTVAGQTNNLTLQSNSGSALISLAESGSVSITAFSSIYQQFTVFGVGYRQNCYPIFSTLDLGSAATPWNNGYFNNLSSAVGGSYKLYNLGTEGDTDTEFLSIGAGTFSGYGIYVNGTGAGATNSQFEILTNSRKSGVIAKSDSVEVYANLSSFAKFAVQNAATYTRQDFRPHSTGNYQCGTTSYRWSNVYSVDGDFSGTVTASAIYNANGGTGIDINANDIRFSRNGFGERFLMETNSLRGVTDDTMSLGTSSFRWANTYSVDGSFSGSLVSEAGGSYKLYNLGTEGDTDTEYGEISWDSNRLILGTQTTGTGIGRDVRITAGLTRIDVVNGGDIQLVRNNATYLICGSANITSYKTVVPNSTSSYNLGSTTNYWARTYSDAVFNNIETITAATDSLVSTDTTMLCDCTSNNIALTIPTSSSDYSGNRYEIKKIDSTSNTVTITPTSRTIDGAASKTISTQYESITIVSDGTNWFIV